MPAPRGSGYTALILMLALPAFAASEAPISDRLSFPNAAGSQSTYRVGGGSIDLTGVFFKPLGAGGRSCGSCHRPAQGWTISADEVSARFEATKGLDPIFRSNDGSNCDHDIDTSTINDRRAAFRLLIERGLIRIVLRVPPNADFEVVRVENPYRCDDRAALSIYRRPLPATNLRFLSSVMWDSRGSSPQAGTRALRGPMDSTDLAFDLAHQALDAADVHAQVAAPLTAQQQQALVEFEMSLVTAQSLDHEAGSLNDAGAKGGPAVLAMDTTPAFFLGINDSKNGDPHGIKAENAFRLFDAWSKLPYGRVYTETPNFTDPQIRRRDQISRGQVLFNQKPFDIRDVSGLNDDLNLPSITGACGTCHNSPNVGNRSVAIEMNTGVADPSNSLGVGYLPRFTLRNTSTGEVRVTSDPARALITGRWKDTGKVKVPVLRGLASRAPYFHNGSARSLADVIEFYDRRFHIGFSAREKEDLLAFLEAL